MGNIVALYADAVRRSPRRYAPGTIHAKLREARWWVELVGDPWSATVHDVERAVSDRRLSASGSRDVVTHVRAFYRWAIRNGHTATDPTATVDLAPVPRRLPRPARDVAIGVAIGAASPAVCAMLALMAGAGLRCVEVSRLRWCDVDLIGGVIHVTGKGNRERVLEIAAPVRRALAAIDADTVHVFTSPTSGAPYRACRVSQIVNRHLSGCAAGCTAHQLRHRFATAALAASGGDLSIVRDLLGHSTVAVTEIYAAVTPGVAGRVARSVPVPGL